MEGGGCVRLVRPTRGGQPLLQNWERKKTVFTPIN
jgi:hypothetical protein